MMGLIIGIYMEMSHPGFGFPALLSIGCLALILLSNFATEAINWLEILLVILGILLLLAEVFILPGFGIVGVMGILLVIFGLIAMLLPSFNTVHFSWNWQEWNLPAIEFVDQLAYNLAVIVAALIIVTLLARYVSPRLLKRSRIVLEGDQQGNVAGPEVNTLPIAGSEGEAFTSLRPGGKVLIQNHLYDALTEGGFIEQGEKVVVSKIQGSAIIVAKKIQK
jgi:membrane-bound ClpP family serine protease